MDGILTLSGTAKRQSEPTICGGEPLFAPRIEITDNAKLRAGYSEVIDKTFASRVAGASGFRCRSHL